MGTWQIKADGKIVLTPNADEAFGLAMWMEHKCTQPDLFINAEIMEAYQNTPLNIPTLEAFKNEFDIGAVKMAKHMAPKIG